ncbi:ScbR family autoregulator-binding transcription factor [Streptomyces roseicoloratus]|uniref:ScbR family autoregulator-binding transcription factor n=1 Tax=Streptomyces roseicoloratus TaxID=2508722 RepID=A0ABY9RVC5_9ACTN|nr:ScbR family autoregulator-binding transcription factor [Streptomyces roseicoloratus]WMX45694.1 ScbR family autoregulator-binding transcription factor [Streptomyces roseicoloratus]
MRTREVLLRAAAEVFGEVGYPGASITKIIDRAGVTTGAVYFHFRSKEGLARAVIQEQAADLDFPEGEPGLQHLLDLTLYLASELQRNTLLRAGVRLAVEQSEAGLQEYSIYEWWAERFGEELDEARGRGELLPDADTGAFASTLVAAFTGAQIMSQLASGRADLPRRITSMWRCLLPGLAPADVIGRLEFTTYGEEGSTR